MNNKRSLTEQIHYLQIETGTACNYRCIYCPVAYYPRKGGFLSLELIRKIIHNLKNFPNIKNIYLNGYDEPTLNPHFIEVVRMFSHLPVTIILFTNATGLTPKLFDEIAETEANIEFDIHLSAVNFQDFQRIHQSKLFNKVIKNIKYLATFKHFERAPVHISMQGRNSATDNQIFEEIQSYFANAPFKVHKWFPNDRAGLLKNDYYLDIHHKTLKGCSLKNRTQEWLHINATGKVILCCQDYFESYVLGDINEQSLVEIVGSETLHRYHQWTTGEFEAPDDYICRRCIFAISDTVEVPNLN